MPWWGWVPPGRLKKQQPVSIPTAAGRIGVNGLPGRVIIRNSLDPDIVTARTIPVPPGTILMTPQGPIVLRGQLIVPPSGSLSFSGRVAALSIAGTSSFNWWVGHPNDGGSDSNSGTSSGSPFATVAKAMSVVSAGQSIGIKPSASIYTERLLNWTGGSSLASQVTLAGSDPLNRPVFRASADISNYAFRLAGVNFVTISDIIIDYTNVPALGLGGRVENAHDILLRRVRLRNLVNGVNSPDDGQLITIGGSDSVTQRVTMLDCECDHNGDTIATNFQHGIYVLNGLDVILDGVYVHDIGAYGVQYFWGSAPNSTVHNGGIIRNSRFNRCGRSGILFGGASNGQIYNNRSWGNGIGLLGSGGGGIRVGAMGVSNTKVWYNSCYNNSGGGSQANFWAGAESSNTEFKNNIARDGSPNYLDQGSGTTQDHNFNFGGTNNDPSWVDPANGDFHLSSGSPARNIGVLVAVLVDAAGVVRDTVTPDAGCFEF